MYLSEWNCKTCDLALMVGVRRDGEFVGVIMLQSGLTNLMFMVPYILVMYMFD
jgi:hypothetical protein